MTTVSHKLNNSNFDRELSNINQIHTIIIYRNYKFMLLMFDEEIQLVIGYTTTKLYIEWSLTLTEFLIFVFWLFHIQFVSVLSVFSIRNNTDIITLLISIYLLRLLLNGSFPTQWLNSTCKAFSCAQVINSWYKH